MRRELVDFIDTYGHDFLNHLQVISGMAQLNKPERIRAYVMEATAQVREINRITKLENAVVAALLLIFHGRAMRYGVPVKFTTRTPFGACPVPEAELGAALEPIFGRLGARIIPALEGAGETVELELTAVDDRYAVGFIFPARPGALINGLNEIKAGIDRAMHGIGGGSDLTVRGGEARLTLKLPRREG